MHRITILAAALLVAAIPTRADAQCSGSASLQSCDWSASVTVTPFLTCTVDVHGNAFNFGAHPRTAGELHSSESNQIDFTCQIDPPGQVSVSFTLPSVLTRVGGTETVPISYGVESARLYDGNQRQNIGLSFHPSTSVLFTPTTGILDITLGENGPNIPEAAVIVNISNASATGTYTGVGTVTIAIP
jgi:hypothetical protein